MLHSVRDIKKQTKAGGESKVVPHSKLEEICETNVVWHFVHTKPLPRGSHPGWRLCGRRIVPEPRWDILGQGQFAKVAVKRATLPPWCTGGLERSIVNHPQHAHVHNPLQELSNYPSDSSWDKAAMEIVQQDCLHFPADRGVSQPWEQGQELTLCLQTFSLRAGVQTLAQLWKQFGKQIDKSCVEERLEKRKRLGHWFWRNQELNSYQLSPSHQAENPQSFPEFQQTASKEGDRNSLLSACKLWSTKTWTKTKAFFMRQFFFPQ